MEKKIQKECMCKTESLCYTAKIAHYKSTILQLKKNLNLKVKIKNFLNKKKIKGSLEDD